MQKSILIVSGELPPLPGRAVTGAGLRMHGIAEGLKKRGHIVRYALSRKRILQEEGIPEYLKEFSYTNHTLASLVKNISPDYVLKIWWGEEDLFLAENNVPVIFDLPAPRLLENVFHNRSSICSWGSKLESFGVGSFFTCPSLLQKAYYLPLLMMSGFNEKEGLIEVMPHGVSLEPERKAKRELSFIFGGVFWPWQNPVKGLNSVIKTLDKHKAGVLKVLTGPLPYNDREERKYLDPVPLLTSSDRLHLSPLLPYQKMREEFSKALVGIDVMQHNLERELSVSFRTLEYLSCGLPVIVGNAGEWAGWIKEYDAGWVVDPEDPTQVEEVVERILLNPDIAKERSLNALRLVKEVFSPEKAVEPLDKFLKAPKICSPGKNSLARLYRLKSSELLVDAGFNGGAEAILSSESENCGNSEWLCFTRGINFLKMNEFDKALNEFKREECFFPGKAENFRLLGVACKEQKSYEEAFSFFKKAEEADPSLEWTHLEKGFTYCFMGESEKAFAEIAKEEELYPGKGETCQAEGVTAMGITDYDRALTCFQKAIDRNPSLLAAKYNLASLLSFLGDEDESALLFLNIADDADSSKSLKAGCFFHVAKILLRQEKNSDAQKHLSTCLTFNPDHREAKTLFNGLGKTNDGER